MSGIELEVGKRYKNKDGQTVLIAFKVEPNTGFDDEHPFIGFVMGTSEWASYSEQGYYDRWNPDDRDLVEELP